MKIHRRNFLKQSLFTAGAGVLSSQIPPVESFIKLLSSQIIKKAYADNELPTCYYLAFHFTGAPARWCFDQFLKTETSQNLIPHIGVATHLTGDGTSYSKTVYDTIDYKGLPVPPIWSSLVPNGSGQLRPLHDLLPHLLAFRGYGTGIDGHPANSAIQTNPVPSLGSTTGLIADHSSKLFRAMQFPPLNNWSGYQSVQNIGLSLVLPSPNPLSQLLNPFLYRADTQELLNYRGRYENAIMNFVKQMSFIKHQKYTGVAPIDNDFNKSIKTIQEGVGELNTVWPTLYAKYESIILSCLKDKSIPGLSDLPVLCPDNDLSNFDVNGKTIRPNPAFDLRDCFKTVNCDNLISSFALAEFVIAHGYGSAFEFGLFQPKNLVGYFGDSQEPTYFDFNFDQHTVGSLPTTFLNGMFFRAFGAALLELIDQLKKMNIFEKTFIHLAQEFGRVPRSDGSGSDHAFDGMMSSIITGLNNDRPIVVGNISLGNTPNPITGIGTYGDKAPTLLNGELIVLTPAHVTSTLATLMELGHNPWANVALPLVLRDGTTLSSIASGDIV